jgi:hypothetical protein
MDTHTLRTCPLAALLAASVLVLGACGSVGPASSSVIVPAPLSTKTVSNAEAAAAAREAVAHCKRAVANARSLPAAAKAELEPTCDKVLGLTGREAQELRHVICNEVANVSSQAEAVRKRVLTDCEREMS